MRTVSDYLSLACMRDDRTRAGEIRAGFVRLGGHLVGAGRGLEPQDLTERCRRSPPQLPDQHGGDLPGHGGLERRISTDAEDDRDIVHRHSGPCHHALDRLRIGVLGSVFDHFGTVNVIYLTQTYIAYSQSATLVINHVYARMVQVGTGDVMATGKSLPATPKKSGDRKRKGATGSPRKVMAFRVNSDLYDKLQSSSQQKELSLTEEIERRLSFSFEMAASAEDEFMLRAFAQALRYSKTVMGRSWVDDPVGAQMTYDAIKSAASLMIHGRGYLIHPDQLAAISEGGDVDVIIEEAKKKASIEMRGAGAAIGTQVAQLFFGRSIQEIESLGREHIEKAKAFAERWHEETGGFAPANLGTTGPA